jgi:hypothetical protein
MLNASLIMDVCKFASYAIAPLTREKIVQCFKDKFHEGYVNRALKAAVQLRLVEDKNGVFVCSQRWRDEIKKASKDELKLPFRQALQDYPPFLVYADLLGKGYSSEDAAKAVRGLFSISSSSSIVEKSLRLWGLYSGTIKQDVQTRQLSLTIDTERLTTKYVEDLLKSLASDFRSMLLTD